MQVLLLLLLVVAAVVCYFCAVGADVGGVYVVV